MNATIMAGVIKQTVSDFMLCEAGYNAPSARTEEARLPRSNAPAASKPPISSANITCIGLRFINQEDNDLDVWKRDHWIPCYYGLTNI